MKPKNLTTSLNLPPVDPLPDGIEKYFNACQNKLGLVPNVLKAHSFNIDKLNAFTGLYNELMLASKWKRMKFVGRMTEVNVRQLPSPSICVQHHMSVKRRIE